jgi:hypothetical protein
MCRVTYVRRTSPLASAGSVGLSDSPTSGPLSSVGIPAKLVFTELDAVNKCSQACVDERFVNNATDFCFFQGAKFFRKGTKILPVYVQLLSFARRTESVEHFRCISSVRFYT